MHTIKTWYDKVYLIFPSECVDRKYMWQSNMWFPSNSAIVALAARVILGNRTNHFAERSFILYATTFLSTFDNSASELSKRGFSMKSKIFGSF